MKNTLKKAAILAFALIVAFALVGCGGNSPEALAKEAASLTKDALKAMESGNLKKYEDLMKKYEALEKKVEALSDKDMEKFEDKLEDLIGDLF